MYKKLLILIFPLISAFSVKKFLDKCSFFVYNKVSVKGLETTIEAIEAKDWKLYKILERKRDVRTLGLSIIQNLLSYKIKDLIAADTAIIKEKLTALELSEKQVTLITNSIALDPKSRPSSKELADGFVS